MAKQFLTDINLNGNIIKNVALEPLGAIPADPTNNRIYYNTVTKTVNVWTGTEWIELNSDNGGLVDVDRAITRNFSDLQGLNLYDEYGGAQIINVTDFIENVFYPLIKATLSLSIAGDNYIEMAVPGVTITPKTFTAAVTVNDWNNSTGVHQYSAFLIDGIEQAVDEYPVSDFNAAESLDITHNLGTVTKSASITIDADGVVHTLTASASFTVRLPDFWGVTNNQDLELAALYSGLTKVLNGAWTTKTLTFVTDDGDYIMFAIPTSWGKKVTSIVDNAGAGDNVTSAFITDFDDGVVLADLIRSVQRTGNWTYDYYVYVTRFPLSVDEQSLQINLGSV